MKHSLILLALCATCHAAPGPGFWRALHIVETSGRTGAILGDYVNGQPQALGPLQIHRGFHQDSRVAGDYSRCAELEYSKRVATAYLKRWAPEAFAKGDVEVLARVFNGGPRGHLKTATKSYGARVKAFSK
jgi:hypothetical protein